MIMRHALVGFTLSALMCLALAAGAQATPMDVTLTVQNARLINQYSFIKLAADADFYHHQTDGNGQFSATGTTCSFGTGPCISPGDVIYISRDQGAGGPGGAPEDPSGFAYTVTSAPAQTITLANTTGDSNHTTPTNTESWIVGKLNQDRAAHSPALPALQISSTLTRAAYAIAHDRALAPTHPFPPPYYNVNLSDWGWPVAGFMIEDSPYVAPETTLAHWDGTAGDAESIQLANHGVFDANNTAVGVADGGGTWIVEYNDCSHIATAFVPRCGMTGTTGDPTAYTPPPPADNAGPPPGGTTGAGGTTGGGTTGGTTGAGTGTLSTGGGYLSVGDGSSGPPLGSTANGVTVKLDCTGVAAKTCAGQILVSLHERTNGSKVMAVLARSGHSKARTVRVTVGLARYTIAAGQIKTVTVALNATGRSLLKRFHRLRVTVVVGVSTATGMTQLASRTVTIKAAAGHKRHKK